MPSRLSTWGEVADQLGWEPENTAAVTEGSNILQIVRPQPVAVRTVWPGEATDFTPWLAENLDWLEPLGLGPLELVGTEVSLPTVNRNLDILARTPDGRAIAIENQYLRRITII